MRTSYTEILKSRVEIPIIQRDYAQGRLDAKTSKIRNDFLGVLFTFIQTKQANPEHLDLELDFIYGFPKDSDSGNTSFIPIDGQQRLTALWLLYWFISVREGVSPDDKEMLTNFTYETRHSTTVFCTSLVKFEPLFDNGSISVEIKNQSWYFETWDYDPSIQAMLVVIDDIEKRYNVLSLGKVWDAISGDDCPFFFYKLDMESVGLNDDLYIKMNSRGKALTEFEYFKASFSEILTDPKRRTKFEQSIDQDWIDAIWKIVLSTKSMEEDIALIVDNSFLNLFNFITSVIAFKDEKRYIDTVRSPDILKEIYSKTENQDELFKTLDSICFIETNHPSFWNDWFYIDRDDFNSSKTRLFFPHEEINLLNRCLFHYTETRGLTFPEQILLYACLTHFKNPSDDFELKIRHVRNVAINSESEIRPTSMGRLFSEVEQFVTSGDLSALKTYRKDQINEEIGKGDFIENAPSVIETLRRLEDSDILRGSTSLFPLDQMLPGRSEKFLDIFDETRITEEFTKRSNLLLCFGDYSQNDKALSNLMAPSRPVIRDFLTTPGYNKTDFNEKTRPVLLKCLDFFIDNPDASIEGTIEESIADYFTKGKDWIYYFLKYQSFREECTLGYYNWGYHDCDLWRMRVKRFNGKHWDPFLFETRKIIDSKNITLGDYGDKLTISTKFGKIFISTFQSKFVFESEDVDGQPNSLLEDLKKASTINTDGELEIGQDSDGIDLDDRIENLRKVILSLI